MLELHKWQYERKQYLFQLLHHGTEDCIPFATELSSQVWPTRAVRTDDIVNVVFKRYLDRGFEDTLIGDVVSGALSKSDMCTDLFPCLTSVSVWMHLNVRNKVDALKPKNLCARQTQET